MMRWITRTTIAIAAGAAAWMCSTDAQARELQRCDWWPTGRAPYTGGVSAALERMPEVPATERDRLAARIALGDADDRVAIHRRRIVGQRLLLAPTITHMSFGRGDVCQRVDRRRWPAGHTEAGSVYRLQGSDWAVLMPDVCGNPSLVRVVGSATRGTADRSAQAALAGPQQPIAGMDAPSVLGARGHVDDDPPTTVAAVGGGLVADVSALRLAELPISDGVLMAQQTNDANPSAAAPTWASPGADDIVPIPWAATAPIGAPGLPAPLPAVPESPTWALLAAGLAAVYITTRRK